MNSGVNLGGWLVLEEWITPSVFNGVKGRDFYSFVTELGSEKAESVLSNHYKNFVTEKDFGWLKENNIQIVRIPVGYWIFGDDPSLPGCLEYLDFAFKQCEKRGIKILIDMHGAAGSQNGQHHSGRSGKINWYKTENQKLTLKVTKKLVERYKNSESFWGIELLNEPDRGIPKNQLLEYYRSAYDLIRKQCSSKTRIIVSDQFRALRWVTGLGRGYEDVLVDRHLYQIFTKLDKRTSYQQKLFIVKYWWKLLIKLTQVFTPMIVGEWSMALPKNSQDGNLQYLDIQRKIFAETKASFYWTYKTEKTSKWSYKSFSKKIV